MATTKTDSHKSNGTEQSALKERAAQMADDAKQRVGDAADKVKDTSADIWNASRAQAEAAHGTLTDSIRKNPTAAVLGAVGVGVLIGLALKKRA